MVSVGSGYHDACHIGTMSPPWYRRVVANTVMANVFHFRFSPT